MNLKIRMNLKISLKASAFSLVFSLLFIVMCSKERDIINQTSDCTAAECHGATQLKEQEPSTGQHTVHLLSGAICENCHYVYDISSDHMNGIIDTDTDADIVFFDNLNINASWSNASGECSSIECHGGGSGLMSWYEGFTGDCTGCHAADGLIDPMTTNGSGSEGKHIVHVNNKNIDCKVCHKNYKSEPTHMNGIYGTAEDVNLINFDTDGTTGWPATGDSVSCSFNDSEKTCNLISCHGGSANNISWYASAVDCASCHAVPETGSHPRHINDYSYECTTCHYGYTSSSTHADQTLNVPADTAGMIAFDNLNPAGSYNTAGDTCSGINNCHGTGVPQWGASVTCSDCHRSAIGDIRQVFDSNGDGSGTGGDFNRTSHHVIDYNDSSVQIITVADCLVCHDYDDTFHARGNVRLNDPDNPGTIISYDPSDPSTLENFCLACHDSNGANGDKSPFSSSNTLGSAEVIAGDEINNNWEKDYGHGTNGNHSASDKLTCMGTGDPGTGCHGSGGSVNAHGSVYNVIATKQYNYPLVSGSFDEDFFSLCFDCHSGYPGKTKYDTLGVKEGGILDNGGWLNNCTSCHPFNPSAPPPYYTSGTTTHFADHDVSGDPWGLNDETVLPCGSPFPCIPTENNLHWLHLGMYDSGNPRRSGLTLVVCSNCHSVHGSDTQYGALHDAIGYENESDGNGNTYGQMKDSAYDNEDIFLGYPTYCDMNCHEGASAPTRAWFREAGKTYIDE